MDEEEGMRVGSISCMAQTDREADRQPDRLGLLT